MLAEFSKIPEHFIDPPHPTKSALGATEIAVVHCMTSVRLFVYILQPFPRKCVLNSVIYLIYIHSMM